MVEVCEELAGVELFEVFEAVLFEVVEFIGLKVFAALLVLVLLVFKLLLSSLDVLLLVPFLLANTIVPVTVELSYCLLY